MDGSIPAREWLDALKKHARPKSSYFILFINKLTCIFEPSSRFCMAEFYATRRSCRPNGQRQGEMSATCVSGTGVLSTRRAHTRVTPLKAIAKQRCAGGDTRGARTAYRTGYQTRLRDRPSRPLDETRHHALDFSAVERDREFVAVDGRYRSDTEFRMADPVAVGELRLRRRGGEDFTFDCL